MTPFIVSSRRSIWFIVLVGTLVVAGAGLYAARYFHLSPPPPPSAQAPQDPDDIVERIRGLCLALPEVTVRVDESGTRARSTAHSFDIRRRSFCLLVAYEDSTGKPVSLLVLRAEEDEREALLSIGHPFFASRAGRDRIVVVKKELAKATRPDAEHTSINNVSQRALRIIGDCLPQR